MKNIITFLWQTLPLALSSLLIFTGISCSEDDTVTKNPWEISGNQIIKIKPQRNKLIRNPMQGWVIYAGIGDGMIDNFWDIYDNFPSSIGNIKVSNYATTLYIRGAWSDFNPQEGVYIWNDGVNTEPAKRFRMLVNGARTRGLKLAFTFIVDSRDKHYDFTPKYVKDAGSKGYTTTTGSSKVWSPYPDDPIFQQKYKKFLTEFAARYNNPDSMEYLSGFGLGKWGETHSLIYSTGDDTPRQAVTDWISNLIIKLFTKVPVVINYHRCIMSGSGFSSNATLLASSNTLLKDLVNKGFCLRHDAFGMKSYYTTWEREYAKSQKFNRPIIMEGGWVESSHGSSISGDGYANYAEVRQGEFSEGKGACVNMMDLRYNNDPMVGETHSWFNSAYSLVNDFISEGGYRLYPDEISVPSSVLASDKISITHRWSNLGWGYCPNNIPQWNQKYKVAFALLDKSSEKPIFTYVDPEPRISDWVKGTPHTYITKFNLSDVPAGIYEWAVGIVDTTKDNTIGLQISVQDKYLTSNGWCKISDVTIN